MACRETYWYRCPSALKKRLNRQATVKYSLVIILGGTNDIFSPATIDHMEEALKEVHGMCHDYGARTVVCSIPEVAFAPGKQLDEEKLRKGFNAIAQRYASANQSKATFLDVSNRLPYFAMNGVDRQKYWDDGLHWTDLGYQKLGEIVFEHIKPIIKSLP